jgi:hypothetical protein
MKLGLVTTAALLSVATIASPASSDQSLIELDRATPIALAEGDELVVQGAARSSIDGARFEITELFDLGAGGLAVVDAHPEAHTFRIRGSSAASAPGASRTGCAASGVTSPCLLPRLASLAHARLVTAAELERSLSGAIVADVVRAPVAPVPRVAPSWMRAAIVAMAALFLAFVASLVAARARARRRTPLGQVHVAAHAARRATLGDPTLATVRVSIDDLVARARELEDARVAASVRLERLDRRALERKRAAWAASSAPEAGEALRWLAAECDEAARLESDLASSYVGLERIAAALRVVALRARRHHGMRARVATGDPVDALAGELALRDEAIEQVRALL